MIAFKFAIQVVRVEQIVHPKPLLLHPPQVHSEQQAITHANMRLTVYVKMTHIQMLLDQAAPVVQMNLTVIQE